MPAIGLANLPVSFELKPIGRVTPVKMKNGIPAQ